jgi:Ca2+-dependent lipid-binding protein
MTSTNNRLSDKAFYRSLISNIQKIITRGFMMVQANTRNQNIKNVGVIIGNLYLADGNEEFPELIFNPIKFIQNS